jgi:hypothetical protein
MRILTHNQGVFEENYMVENGTYLVSIALLKIKPARIQDIIPTKTTLVQKERVVNV